MGMIKDLVGDDTVCITYNNESGLEHETIKCEKWRYRIEDRVVMISSDVADSKYATIVPIDNVASITLPLDKKDPSFVV